jgi:hypothetical protein
VDKAFMIAPQTFIKALARSLGGFAIAALLISQSQAQSLLRDTEIEETLREFSDPLLRAG